MIEQRALSRWARSDWRCSVRLGVFRRRLIFGRAAGACASQVEFYFSDSNLPRDKFMSEKVAENAEGCECAQGEGTRHARKPHACMGTPRTLPRPQTWTCPSSARSTA